MQVLTPAQEGFQWLCLNFFLISTGKESSQPTKHANKIIVLIFWLWRPQSLKHSIHYIHILYLYFTLFNFTYLIFHPCPKPSHAPDHMKMSILLPDKLLKMNHNLEAYILEQLNNSIVRVFYFNVKYELIVSENLYCKGSISPQFYEQAEFGNA